MSPGILACTRELQGEKSRNFAGLADNLHCRTTLPAYHSKQTEAQNHSDCIGGRRNQRQTGSSASSSMVWRQARQAW